MLGVLLGHRVVHAKQRVRVLGKMPDVGNDRPRHHSKEAPTILRVGVCGRIAKRLPIKRPRQRTVSDTPDNGRLLIEGCPVCPICPEWCRRTKLRLSDLSDLSGHFLK
jgi:hypothetical protein